MYTRTQHLPCVVGLIGRLSVRAVFQTALVVLWGAQWGHLEKPYMAYYHSASH